MQTEHRPLVSFVIPTLNRGWYVSRAIESCLRNSRDSLDIEVVVIDSSSDDGSFENLKVKYGRDRRVRLLQNSRDSGPVKSWLEGVDATTGKFMTFVWSDDLISPFFLRMLLPPLQDGGMVAYGAGKIVDVGTEMEFSESTPDPELVDGHSILERYYDMPTSQKIPVMRSPVCSLFDGKLVREWALEVRKFCRATPLREHIMWCRAIGPDLMLYLSAVTAGTAQVALFRTYTAQFSKHPGSISISNKYWTLEVGYWLAKRGFVEKLSQNEYRGCLEKLWANTFIDGCFWLLVAPLLSHGRPFFFGVLRELTALLIVAWRGGFLGSGLHSTITECYHRAEIRLRKRRIRGGG